MKIPGTTHHLATLVFVALAWGCHCGGALRVVVGGGSSSMNLVQVKDVVGVNHSWACPSKTVNYITHSLPQLCLRTNWSSTRTAYSSITQSNTGPTSSVAFSTTHATDVAEPSGSRVLNVQEDPLCSASSSSGPIAKAPATAATLEASAVFPTTTLQSSSVVTSRSALPTESAAAKVEADVELGSALDNANFLSFEEWKRLNLAGSGQSPDGLGEKRLPTTGTEPRQRPRSINHALDSLGDDTEIDLDFERFKGTPSTTGSTSGPLVNGGRHQNEGDPTGGTTAKDTNTPQRPRTRNKDAGKTCKERFNYASFDCAATVLKTNPECKGSSSVLVENKDSYMLNECSASNQFFIVELCDDILIDTVVLANFEFFSSIFRTFRVSVSDRYPVKIEKWRELGTFVARNTREMQAFVVENPLIWARYIRVELLTHYGNEYYCPISLLRVHGTTMIEEFKHQEDLNKGEGDDEGEETEGVEVSSTALSNEELEKATHNTDDQQADSQGNNLPVPVDSAHTGSQHSQQHIQAVPSESAEQGQSSWVSAKAPKTPLQLTPWFDSTSLSVCHVQVGTHAARTTELERTLGGTNESNLLPSRDQPSMLRYQVGTPPVVAPRDGKAAESMDPSLRPLTKLEIAPSSQAATPTRAPSRQSQDASRNASSATHPPLANPTTQESFFKTVHKRLQLLEANATLSLQYIEEQSRILRDAFAKVEKRQLAKTNMFLEHLNATVFAELRGIRQQYDQIWQSTVIELEDQREQSQREIVAVSARLGILANEVILQKRMAIIQSVLLFLCLAFVIFSRSSISEHLELPMMQNVMSRSRRRRQSRCESQSTSPALTRPGSSREGGGEELFEMDSEHRQCSHDDGGTTSPTRLTVQHSLSRSISSNELSDSESRSELSTIPSSMLDVSRRSSHVSRSEAQLSPSTPTALQAWSEDALDNSVPLLFPITR